MAKKRHPPTDENGKKHQNRHFWPKKSACGKPPAEENGPFPRETLFGPKKKRLRQAASQKTVENAHFFYRKNGKNINIVTKWSSMGRNRTATLPKLSEKQDLQESDRVFAPKPQK